MESIQGFDYFRLEFDREGNPIRKQALEEMEQRAQSAGATDAILIAHGFRNDENEATGLYTNFLTTFRAHLNGAFRQSLGARKFVVAGVYWPSKPFREQVEFGGSAQAMDNEAAEKAAVRQQLEEMKAADASAAQKPRLERAIQLLDRVKSDAQAQDEFVRAVLSLLDGSSLDPTEGIDRIRATEGSELLDKLKMPIIVPSGEARGDAVGVAGMGPAVIAACDEGGAASVGSAFASVFGRIGQFLNLTTWYVMKDRAGVVGANGVSKAVRDLKAKLPSIRVHLVGHSLGGRLMAACAKALAQPPKVQPDSVSLLEAAFSHYGFSPNNGRGQQGFFRSVMTEKVVKGPLVATFSAQDSVVGKVYAVASRLAGDNVEEIGDANDPFGGIGRNGAQRTAEAVFEPLRAAGSPLYQFPSGKIVNLDGSGGLIRDHGDVTNPHVTFAVACAVAQT